VKITQLTINSVSVKGSLEEMLPAFRKAGFGRVEFSLWQVREYLGKGGTPAGAKKLLDDNGLRCAGGFEHALECFSDPGSRNKNLGLIAASAELLAALGGTMLVMGTDGPSQPCADPVGPIAEALAGAAKRLEPYGVSPLLEFNWSPVVKSLRTAIEVVRLSGTPRAGVLFDTAHYHCTPTKLDQINAGSVPLIRHVHLNDMRNKPGELSNCNSDRVLPGQGCLDLKEIIGALDRNGYSDLYAIELFNDDLWNMPPERAARLMYESLLPFCS
jgi:4-hydroxyphenylpyruvate dioxygenase